MRRYKLAMNLFKKYVYYYFMLLCFFVDYSVCCTYLYVEHFMSLLFLPLMCLFHCFFSEKQNKVALRIQHMTTELSEIRKWMYTKRVTIRMTAMFSSKLDTLSPFILLSQQRRELIDWCNLGRKDLPGNIWRNGWKLILL